MNQHLLWLDLETTGLSPFFDHVLEVSCSLAPMHAPFDAEHVLTEVISFQRAPHRTFDEAVERMHHVNGLWEESAKYGRPLKDVEAHILSAIMPIEGQLVLAGSSVHFDLGFLRVHMPDLAARLSHRIYDVSAIKMFCESIGMTRMEKNDGVHRARHDVAESIATAKRCAAWKGWHR